MSQQKRRGDLVAVRDAGLCLGVAASTAALTLVFFFPCFTNWQGLQFPELDNIMQVLVRSEDGGETNERRW